MALIIPKNNADTQTLDATLKIYYDTDDWVQNAVLINKLSAALDDLGIEDEKKEPQSYTKKTQVLAYFGFITWQDVTNSQSARRITALGRRFYEARLSGNTDRVLEVLIESLSTCTFGRNVIGCDSDSDIEAPNVFIKASLLLGGLNNNEFAFILGKMELSGADFSDTIFQIKVNRLRGIKTYPSDSAKKWNDPKPITALKNWGFFNSDDNTISDSVLLKYSDALVKLRIKNSESIEFKSTSEDSNSVIHQEIKDNSYIAAIKTKPFLILGGFSGTGKSQKVKELAFLTCPNDEEMRKKLGNTENTPGNYCLVSVRPNWHDSTDLLGYYSSINDKYIVTDFVRFLVKAMQYPEIPFFVCLDEMNLAPVEEYFAEYLSVLESRKKVGKEIKTDPLVSCDWFKKDYKGFNIFDELGLLRVGRTQSTGENRQASMFGDTDDDAFDRLDIVAKLKKYGLCLPPNVVVIGTVNMDDTTNSFSRKVIDRAMTFETIVEEFDNKYYEAEDTMTYGGYQKDDWTWILPDEVRANEAIEHTPDLLEDDQKIEVTNFINEVNTCLKGSPFQIAYRILNETILYYRATKIVNRGEADLNKVFDDILMQKVLPRIEGDYDKTYKPLAALRTKAETMGWMKSKEKIDFMLGRFSKDDQGGFTSFWN